MIGKIAKCSLCRQQKVVYFESPTGRIICRECYLNRNTCKCSICTESTYLSLYYTHLLQHTKEDLARCISDFEEKKNFRGLTHDFEKAVIGAVSPPEPDTPA